MLQLLGTFGPSIRSHYNGRVNALHVIVSGSPCSADWRQAIQFGIGYIEQNAISRWISDIKEMGVLDPADTDWVAAWAVPRAMQAGLRYMANVVPDDVYAQLAMQSWSDADGFENSYFLTTAEAEAWLAGKV